VINKTREENIFDNISILTNCINLNENVNQVKNKNKINTANVKFFH